MNDDDTFMFAVLNIVEATYLPLKNNIAIVGTKRINATEHVHQRGFSRAVLAAYGMNLAFLDFDIYLIQRLHAWEFLGDIQHFQDRIAQVTFLPILKKETDEGFVRLLSSVVCQKIC